MPTFLSRSRRVARRCTRHLSRAATGAAALFLWVSPPGLSTLSAQAPSSPSVPVPAPDTSGLWALRAELARIVDESPVHGVAVGLVSAAGPIWSGGFGTADPRTGEPVGAGTLFRANSVSKTLVALSVMRLVEEGVLSLSTPLREAAPDLDFENPWEASHPLTVAHLLEHTSGFDELHFREYGFSPEDGGLARALAVNPSPRTSRWPPGHWMAYNNGGYAVAARIVEGARGTPFEEVVRDEVLVPLGMHASGLVLEHVNRPRLARHFLAVDAEEPAAPYPVIIRPAGGLITSADDLGGLVTMLLRRGEPLLSAGSVERMEVATTSRGARAGLSPTYGLGIYGELDGGHRWLGHAGGTPSAWARYAYDPEAGVGYVVLMNGSHGPTRRRLERALRDALVPPAATGDSSVGGPITGSSEAAAQDTVDLHPYAGFYRPAATPWSLTAGIERLLGGLRVEVADGRLVVSPVPTGPSDTLTRVTGDRFRSGGGSATDLVFLRKDDGEVDALVAWDPANISAGNRVRSPAPITWAPLVALALGLPLLLAGLVVAPLRSGLRRIRGRTSLESPWARRLPPLAALSLVAAVGVLVTGVSGPSGTLALARPGVAAVGFHLATWAFAALSIAALLVTARAVIRERGPGGAARWWSFAVALACTTILVFLTAWGVVGLRTWAW